MPGLTEHFGLQELYAGDPFSTNGQKYTTTDRATIDRLLWLGALGHQHTGQAAANNDPTAAPSLGVDTTQGYIPASTQVSYVYTFVDSSGAETGPSPAAFVTTPAQTATPAPPNAVAQSGSGTLIAGGYWYSLSAYTGTNTSETPASAPAYATLTAAGEITLDLPTLPSGASGFNIYRKGPGGSSYLYIASVAMNVATPPTTFLDDGSYQQDCNRFAPTSNTTQSTNTVNVSVAAPPAGWTWNLYRTTVVGDWTNSLLASVTTLDSNGNIVTTYQDLGLATQVGAPPVSSQLVGSPSKIDLSSEVTGLLAPANVDAYLTEVVFAFPGTLGPQDGQSVWVCNMPQGQIVSIRPALGRDSVPASQPVIVDVKTGSGTNPTYTSLFASMATPVYPEVPVGEQIGALVTPPITALNQGDSMVVDVLQAGGGATPSDRDLTVTVTILLSSTGLPSTNPF